MLKCIICGKEVERCYLNDKGAETCPEPVCSEACEIAHINASVKVVIPPDPPFPFLPVVPAFFPKKDFDVEEYRRFCADLFDALKDEEDA